MDRLIEVPTNAERRAWLARHGIRAQVFVIFTLLLIATLAIIGLSLFLLKKNFRDTYYHELDGRMDVVQSILTSAAGETALLNGSLSGRPVLSPYVLNVSAIDVENPRKAFDSASQSGCLASFGKVAQLCAAMGNRPAVGAYLYIVGWIDSDPISPHAPGQEISAAHHIELETTIRGETDQWLVVFQRGSLKTSQDVDLYAAGYRRGPTGETTSDARYEREFKGRLNYAPSVSPCAEPQCGKRWQFAFRVPIDNFRADSLNEQATWPPKDYRDLRVHLRVLSPTDASGASKVIVDSSDAEATRVYSLDSEIGKRFSSMERVEIFRSGGQSDLLWASHPIGSDDRQHRDDSTAGWLISLIPVQLSTNGDPYRRRVMGRFGTYDLLVTPSEDIANDYMKPLASQFVLMLFGILVVLTIGWWVVELRIVQRIGKLTKGAEKLTERLHHGGDTIHSEFEALRGADELGILASGIHELLLRVNEDLRIRRQRVEQDREVWHSIGHEISSPLQSLLTLHPEGNADDLSRRYLVRMERAVRALYSSGSVESASWSLSIELLDLNKYLQQLCDNAPVAGYPPIEYRGAGAALLARTDEFGLEQVLSHILNNAKRYNPEGESVVIALVANQVTRMAEITIENKGPCIPEDTIDEIFQMGMSDGPLQGELFAPHRGQGLFVARSIMASMAGSISASNLRPTGVTFTLSLPLP